MIGITAVFALCAVVYTFFARRFIVPTHWYKSSKAAAIRCAGYRLGISQQTACIGRRDPVIRSRLVLGKTVDDLDLDIA